MQCVLPIPAAECRHVRWASVLLQGRAGDCITKLLLLQHSLDGLYCGQGCIADSTAALIAAQDNAV